MKTVKNTIVQITLCEDNLYRVFENNICVVGFGYPTEIGAFEEYFFDIYENYKRQKHKKFLSQDCDFEFILAQRDLYLSLKMKST